MFPLLPLFTLIFILNSNFVTSSTYPDSCDSFSSCSDGINIDYPFSEHQNTSFCGYPDFTLECSSADGKTVINISNNAYYVRNLDTAARMLTVVNKYVLENECPRPVHNLTDTSPFLLFNLSRMFMTIFYNCSAYPQDELHISCLEFNNTKRSYAFLRDVPFPQFDWYGNCEENVVVPLTRLHYNDIFNDSNYKTALQLGFQLYWSTPTNCLDCERLSQGKCWTNTLANQSGCYCRQQDDGICLQDAVAGPNIKLKVIISIVIAVATAVGVIILALLFVYKRSLFSLRKPMSLWIIKIRNPTNVDVFLQNYECVALQRYNYADVKKMTNSFKDTLGQGGYGSVFKGCLADGQLVAVKVLKETKGNGDEFINEVATIGRTNHVNVVSLLGYSNHGSKRALIYEFMPNGSLERFIYNNNNSSTTAEHLGWEKLYQIALGIARGLEYLHRGCKMRILHFDIKPHNILLDEEFCPKISDFGLAKLCPTRESGVSMLAARGTIGYIAPEVYCRNFGSVSYKSDVYSYGMMVLEIVGGRKNIDATVENTSEIYFPNWIYNQLEKDIALGGSEEIFKEEIRKKMVLVGLWCIQTHPTNRPSMTKVVEMLEGSIEDLEMPPNPSIDPHPTPFIDLPPPSSSATS